jgi:hypothetical protein
MHVLVVYIIQQFALIGNSRYDFLFDGSSDDDGFY